MPSLLLPASLSSLSKSHLSGVPDSVLAFSESFLAQKPVMLLNTKGLTVVCKVQQALASGLVSTYNSYISPFCFFFSHTGPLPIFTAHQTYSCSVPLHWPFYLNTVSTDVYKANSLSPSEFAHTFTTQ